jgi:hypothetical protein
MDVVVLSLGAVGLVFALLLARGMFLIGRGTDAEEQARVLSSGRVSSTGWMTLDALRDANIPVVVLLEQKLEELRERFRR